MCTINRVGVVGVLNVIMNDFQAFTSSSSPVQSIVTYSTGEKERFYDSHAAFYSHFACIMCVTNGGNIIDVCMIWQKILAFFLCIDRHMCMSVCEYIYIFMLACMNR